MIKVNLAKKSGRRSSQDSQTQTFTSAQVMESNLDLQKAGLKKLIILILVPGLMFAWEYFFLPARQEVLNQKISYRDKIRSENLKSKKDVDEIKKYEEEEKKLNAEIAAINQLSKERFREVRILETIQMSKTEKLNLTRLEMAENKLILRGLAINDQEITSFHENLQKSVYFKEITPGVTREKTTEYGVFKEFEMNLVLEGT